MDAIERKEKAHKVEYRNVKRKFKTKSSGLPKFNSYIFMIAITMFILSSLYPVLNISISSAYTKEFEMNLIETKVIGTV